MARLTFHLVPQSAWKAADPTRPWASASLADEGFIHCTDGVEAMLATANRFYADVPGDFLALTVDLDECGSRWRIDEPGTPYPHIYGTIDRAAILDIARFERDEHGRFTGIGPRVD